MQLHLRQPPRIAQVLPWVLNEKILLRRYPSPPILLVDVKFARTKAKNVHL